MFTKAVENKIDFKAFIGFSNVKSRYMKMKEITQGFVIFRFYIQFITTKAFHNNRIFHDPK